MQVSNNISRLNREELTHICPFLLRKFTNRQKQAKKIRKIFVCSKKTTTFAREMITFYH